MYTLSWKNPALPGKANITVNVASTVTNAASLTFTGKGAANYGSIQQTNLLRLLENFADGTAPLYPTLGQTWFDSTAGVLNVCTSIAPVAWEALSGVQITNIGTAPTNPSIGDMWFEKGTHSGFLYVYTGTGRYPKADWDAHASGFYPAVSPLVAPYLNIKINYSDFTTPNFNESYIHGFSGASPADTDGQILVNGVLTNVPRGYLASSHPGDALILWDTTATLTSLAGPGVRFFAVRYAGDHRFEYDDNTKWVTFTPIDGMFYIGAISVAETDDNTAPGIASAEVWQRAVPVSSYFNFNTGLIATNGAIGGWNQVWPTVEHFGARFEYDAMAAMLLQLIGTPASFGGSLAQRGLGLTDFGPLDASQWVAGYSGVQDANFGPLGDTTYVAVEPTADDWDRLLAAARWAISRLDLPTTMLNSVSAIPFTMDGRVAAPDLQALSTYNVRKPARERSYTRRWGSITGARLYAETMNALAAGVTARYSMKGIAGQNSTITALSLDVASYIHAVHNAAYVGGGPIFQAMYFKFENQDEALAFQNGGGAIDLKLDYTLPGSPNANDTAFKAFIDSHNTIRITADKTRVFTNAFPLSFAVAPVAGGFNAGGAGVFTNIAVFTLGASSISVAVARDASGGVNGSYLAVRLALTGPAPMSGSTRLQHSVIRDTQTYGADVPFFRKPTIFVAGTDTPGSDLVWVNSSPGNPPVVNFAASTTTGVAPLTVNFTFTGTGSPTLVEWDFSPDGTYDGTGLTATANYTVPGTYDVRCRATNGAGQDILTRRTYITVT